jgi:hypothetical protein
MRRVISNFPVIDSHQKQKCSKTCSRMGDRGASIEMSDREILQSSRAQVRSYIHM